MPYKWTLFQTPYSGFHDISVDVKESTRLVLSGPVDIFYMLKPEVLSTMVSDGQTSRSTRSDGLDTHNNLQPPFRVLGIALVVDILGKEARMVMRYPSSSLAHGTEDLFFRLSPRQMAKLFRPKSALCGQPITLSVGGTVFCCCAILMDDGHGTSGSNIAESDASSDDGMAGNATATDQLSLFSVIVALAPPIRLSSIPITGWLEGHSHDYHNLHPNVYSSTANEGIDSKSAAEQAGTSSSSRFRKVSQSFLSIRRVHISLVRLCRLLEREERRCQYVSIQTSRFQQVWKSLEQKWNSQANESVNTSTSDTAGTESSVTRQSLSRTGSGNLVAKPAKPSSSSAANSPVSTMSTKTAPQTNAAKGRNRHRRNHSFSFFERDGASIPSSSTKQPNQKPQHQQEGDSQQLENVEAFRQEFLDTIMSLPPDTTDREEDAVGEEDGADSYHSNHHYGNLARELIQVFHALARNDYDFTPTPGALLSGRDGLVFINRHLATAIEAVSRPPADFDGTTSNKTIRPFHTLLFPHASASELLESLTSSSCGHPPRRLQQFLRTIHAQKSLAEVAVEANLPLNVTLDVATYLHEQGICVVSSVLSRNSRLACRCIHRIPQVSLAFAQTFCTDLSVFQLVAYLTAGRALGEAMVAWKQTDSQWLQEALQACCPIVVGQPDGTAREVTDEEVVEGGDEKLLMDDNTQALEDLLFEMTIWLCAHKVLVQVEEYLVGTTVSSTGGRQQVIDEEIVVTSTLSSAAEHKTDLPRTNSWMEDEQDVLYKELLDAGCLEGDMSLPACSWQIRVDSPRLRAFAIQHPLIRLVSRVPVD